MTVTEQNHRPEPFMPPRSVAITGACGNLGRKLIATLLETAWCERIIAIDRENGANGEPDHARGRVVRVTADLLDMEDLRWRDAIAEAEGVVHLAAQNPYPDAGWDDASASFDMSLRIAEIAARSGVKRLVFASSNHVMGRYKDPPLADQLQPGGLTTDLVPGPGTLWFDGARIVDAQAYAVAKLMGERLVTAKAQLAGGVLTAVSVRIGWCQPGDNDPATINASGVPRADLAPAGEDARDLAWFRNMWLSNRDFGALMVRALAADPGGWPSPGIIVNGMSANRGMPWDLEGTRHLLGYAPQDDIWTALGM
jgi:nucleoside-diphosphate-sugar epimerase